MEIDGDRLNPISCLSPLSASLSLCLSLFLKFLADGDGWCGASGLSPCRLIIDQEDRDGLRGGEDTEELGESGGQGQVEKWEDFKRIYVFKRGVKGRQGEEKQRRRKKRRGGGRG